MNTTTPQHAARWYTQFWPWFLIILLLSSIGMGLLFAYLATHGSDPLIDENYYQHGLDINKTQQQKTAPAPAPTPTPTHATTPTTIKSH